MIHTGWFQYAQNPTKNQNLFVQNKHLLLQGYLFSALDFRFLVKSKTNLLILLLVLKAS